MQVTSPVFQHKGRIPVKYTCDGENINPPLVIGDVPEKARTLALVMDDPDAPRGTFTHWTLWNIAPGARKIAENSVPAGSTEGMTSFGRSGYGGPCPPAGTHRYFFKIYALDGQLNLNSDADKAKLEEAMRGHILDQAELVGLYSRDKAL
ncbi:MAG: YbhB/YbcL family Raf kinase inhibitor-like protein [Candidatus Doudnabacteria bacterium]|nr:YbhB/YbcL family Raf kinase inhibitor-like protein [Candidatus Doudnabacteria bacterium]